ncbi:hypothetical protein [Rhizobium sp. PAMB 3182]
MSDSYLIATGGRAPTDYEENAAFHAKLVELLAAEVRHQKWPGAVFRDYARTNGLVAIQVAPGLGDLTIEGLRQFREEQRERKMA